MGFIKIRYSIWSGQFVTHTLIIYLIILCLKPTTTSIEQLRQFCMESMIDIQNIVASTKLAEDFDLNKIKTELEGTEYNKERFPGLVYRIEDPKACFLIFTSGKVVCTGLKNIENVHTAIINLALRYFMWVTQI